MEYKMYDCKAVKLVPPSNFIKMNCGSGYKNEVVVDECLSEEIKWLWENGIRTTGCCCGHGCDLGFIQVDKQDVEKMEKLGYQQYLYVDTLNGADRLDAFIPKTTRHKTTNKIRYRFEIKNRTNMGEDRY